MKKKEFLALTRMLLASFVFLSGAVPLYAAQPRSQTRGPNSSEIQSRSMETVTERRGKRITHAQRKAAAARLAANPVAAKRLADYQKKLASATDARIKNLEARQGVTVRSGKTAGGGR